MADFLAAQEATQVELKNLQNEISTLNETMGLLLSAILEKMPRVTGNDQMAVSIEAGFTGLTSAQTLTAVTTVTTVGTVTNQTQIGGQEAITAAKSQIMAGAQHIYNNIEVS